MPSFQPSYAASKNASSGTQRMQWRALLYYGVLALPLAMLGLPLYIYLPTFYAQDVGMDVATVGALLLIARLFDMAIDPFIGVYSDKNGAKVSRKALMSMGVVLLLLSFYALIHPSRSYAAIWLLLFSMLTYAGWSLVNIPYLALSAQLSSDYHEKTRINSSRELFGIAGAMIALVVVYAFHLADDAASALALLFYSVAMGFMVLFPMTLLGVKQRIVAVSHPLHATLGTIVSQIKAVPSLRRLQLAFLLNALANALPATLFLFFVELVLDAKALSGQFLLLYFFSGMVGLAFWVILAKRIGKKKSWIASMLLASGAFTFVLVLDAGDTLAFGVICAISGLSLGADMALPSAMQSDTVQTISKQAHEVGGTVFALFAMLTKLSMALAVGIGFMALGAVGFDAAAPTPAALSMLVVLYALLPVMLKAVATALMWHYDETH